MGTGGRGEEEEEEEEMESAPRPRAANRDPKIRMDGRPEVFPRMQIAPLIPFL